MLDIKFIRENPEKVKGATEAKQQDPKIVDKFLAVDKEKRELLAEIEDLRAQRNTAAKAKDIEKGKKIKKQLRELEPKLKKLDEEFKGLLSQVPNPAAKDVPVGKDESENVFVRKWGEILKFDFKIRDHLELGELLDIIDVKRAAKVSGSRFGYLKGDAVLLEFALIRLAFETLTKEGFVPVIPPVMISLDSMRGMGYLEHGGDENMYILDEDDLVLVGTSEQSIGPMHRDEILKEDELPRRYVGFSTCFRREAGSYGKDTRGILRVHQFNKVEMFSFTTPEQSDKEHEFLLSMEEKLMQAIKLPYQVIKMCTGDLGDPAARKYDIEAWLPSEEKYRETHSTSTCTDYQARRLNIRFKRKKGEVEFVHTLNGTAFSERPILAILENYQQKDGSVVVPKILREYMGKDVIPA